MSTEVKRMAELLKSGAAMLQETCPECQTPLFKIGGQIRCSKCDRQVIIVKSGSEETEFLGGRILEGLEQTILAKIQEADVAMKNENDPDRLGNLSNLVLDWLTALEKVRQLKPSSSQPQR